jgi:predicted DNA-binding transcriptional regulator AlpA
MASSLKEDTMRTVAAISTHTPAIRASSRAGFLTAAQVVERYHTSFSWILRRQRHDGFPDHVKFGRLRFWRLAAVEQWELSHGA